MTATGNDKLKNFFTPRTSVWIEKRDPICLTQLLSIEAVGDEQTQEVQQDLLAKLECDASHKGVVYKCGVTACDRTISYSPETGKTIDKACRLAGFCLGTEWEQSGLEAQAGDLTRFYDIKASCKEVVSNTNLGYLCPNLACELSAGFSIDGVAGTAGECERPNADLQLPLPIEVSE